MAESVDLDQLRSARTSVKRQFSRLANGVLRMHTMMSEEELRDSILKLTTEAGRVLEANDDVEEQYTAESADRTLSEQQRSDLDKTATECERKLEQLKDLIQKTLWDNYGEYELTQAITTAESQAEDVGTVDPSTSTEAYDFVLMHLEKLVKTAKTVHRHWKNWAPPAEKQQFQRRIRSLEIILPKLTLRKASFIEGQTREDAGRLSTASLMYSAAPAVKLRPTSLPKFTGVRREFHQWKKDWEALQVQGEPSGSREIRKYQLLDSIDERTGRDLRLSSYTTAEEIFRVLENRFGNKTNIALEIVEELQTFPAVKGNQPRKIVELIQIVQKALIDLKELGATGAIKNPLVTKAIETKLPDALKKEWLLHVAGKDGEAEQDNRFDYLLSFLHGQEAIYEKLDQLREEESKSKFEPRQARTRSSTQSLSNQSVGCVVCGDGKHKKRLYFCQKFRTLKQSERKEAVRKLGACKKCLEIHNETECCKTEFLCRRPDCNEQRIAEHHYCLCPKAEMSKGNPVQRSKDITVGGGSRGRYTQAQEGFIKGLTPDMAEKCRNVFCNAVTRTSLSNQPSPLAENDLMEWPVIMMLLEVTANAGQRVGTLIDLASDTNYLTHDAAEQLNLKSEPITLVVHGVGGMKVQVTTKRYLLKIRVRTEKGNYRSHQLLCYGLDSIADVHRHVTAKRLQTFFPDIPLSELVRPKEIQLLISHKEGRLVPQKIRTVGDLVLWDGPLGKTVAGSHPDLLEEARITAHQSRTHFARSMRTAAMRYTEHVCTCTSNTKQSHSRATNRDFIDWWKWDSIGAACTPRCGGCRCGQCQPGGKDMTLAEERELEVVMSGLTYAGADDHRDCPHWHASYPWLEDPCTLPNNKRAVEATFSRTERQLAKDPQWKKAYSAQVHEMVDRRAAKKLTADDLRTWKGPVWYISHLIAPNPHSVTTPVRLVWNSSQRYKGQSLNDLLMKGPDVLNPIRAVLLKFRQGSFAALGDIKKMYNSVWLEEREVHLHRFLWRDSENEKLEEYAITRVNIGDRPAGCIAQLAMRETSKLPQFSHLEDEQRVLQEHSYVDDILTSHNCQERLKTITDNVEQILRAGGFALKPWVFSGQCGGGKEETSPKIVVLPNQMKDDDNKALGLGYIVEEDELHVLVRINFSKRKKKMRLGQDLLLDEVLAQTPNPLTRRELLSQVAGLYDPIGLTTPAKQKGAILVRRAFQEAKPKSSTVKDTWDLALSDDLRQDAIQLFKEYVQLSGVTFPRALTPPDASTEPIAITFSDGSENSYGAVLYLRWNCGTQIRTRLVESKAKLTPLDHKGDAVKAELCGAVFSSRLKRFFEEHTQIKASQWYHLVDSQTILGAIQRESYGFQTFFANRIGEIQSSTQPQNWWWVPGQLNVADMITRGGGPKELDSYSEWQQGPDFLHHPESEWPIKSAKEVSAAARKSITTMQKKSFVAAHTRAQTRRQNEVPVHRHPAGIVIQSLMDVKRFSSLSRLVKTIAVVWRAARRFLTPNKSIKDPKWEAIPTEGVVSASERQDALRDLFLAAQEGVTFPATTTDRLVVYREPETGLLVCGGRIHGFREDGRAVPLLPPNAWVSTLLAREAHNEAHEGVAATLLKMRKSAWVIKGRRIAQKVVGGCIYCKKSKAKLCQQIMGDLPPERTRPAAPFEYTTVDLFGPYHVRDDIKKRVTAKVWGVVFSCMTSRAVHADLVNTLSTESFLLTYQRFTAIRGHPRRVWSDPGTNFVGSKPVLKDLYSFLDGQNKAAVEELSAQKGTKWNWTIHPADSPHRNGAAEAAVRILKKALQSLGPSTGLSYCEFQTTLQLAANLANERPIDATVQSHEHCVQYVSPNTLLLGRASPTGDIKTFDFTRYPYKRLREMQHQVDKFWRSWSQLAGPNMFVRSKWHTSHRNVAVGDVVWLCDQNAVRGQFRLGRVVAVNPDGRGVVRDVNVKVVQSSSLPVTRSTAGKQSSKVLKDAAQTTVLHRDVRRLVVLLPAEDQT